MSWDLRNGPWQETMTDVEADVTISDPPYSAKTHAGVRTQKPRGVVQAGGFEYEPLDYAEAKAAARWMTTHTKRKIVVFGDHITAEWWRELLDVRGWTVFAPLPWVKLDAPPRFSGDGPGCSTEWLTVAHRKGSLLAGSPPGHYLVKTARGHGRDAKYLGGKSLEGMTRLVRDYVLPGEILADLYAGMGTTLAASPVNVHAIGAEKIQATWARANARLLLLDQSAAVTGVHRQTRMADLLKESLSILGAP